MGREFEDARLPGSVLRGSHPGAGGRRALPAPAQPPPHRARPASTTSSTPSIEQRSLGYWELAALVTYEPLKGARDANTWPALLCLLAPRAAATSPTTTSSSSTPCPHARTWPRSCPTPAGALGRGACAAPGSTGLGAWARRPSLPGHGHRLGRVQHRVDGLLTLLENIRGWPPTTREPDRRIWGPSADEPPGPRACAS